MFDFDTKKEEKIKRMVSTLVQLDLTGINLISGKADTLLEYQNELKREGRLHGIDEKDGPEEHRFSTFRLTNSPIHKAASHPRISSIWFLHSGRFSLSGARRSAVI